MNFLKDYSPSSLNQELTYNVHHRSVTLAHHETKSSILNPNAQWEFDHRSVGRYSLAYQRLTALKKKNNLCMERFSLHLQLCRLVLRNPQWGPARSETDWTPTCEGKKILLSLQPHLTDEKNGGDHRGPHTNTLTLYLLLPLPFVGPQRGSSSFQSAPGLRRQPLWQTPCASQHFPVRSQRAELMDIKTYRLHSQRVGMSSVQTSSSYNTLAWWNISVGQWLHWQELHWPTGRTYVPPQALACSDPLHSCPESWCSTPWWPPLHHCPSPQIPSFSPYLASFSYKDGGPVGWPSATDKRGAALWFWSLQSCSATISYFLGLSSSELRLMEDSSVSDAMKSSILSSSKKPYKEAHVNEACSGRI